MEYSLLQVRNLSQNTLLYAGTTLKERTLPSFKASFKITVPNSGIQSRIVNLQTAQTRENFLMLLPALRDAIDAIIPPVHSPTSLNDILSELRRFQSLINRTDQEILFIAYFPMISYFLDVGSLRDVLGTSQQTAYINAFVLDFENKLNALKVHVTLSSPPVPPFGRTGLTKAYSEYISSYKIARNDVDRLRTLTAYRNFVNNIIDGQTRPVEKLPTSVNLTGFYGPSIDPTSKTFMIYISGPTPGLAFNPGMTITGLYGVQGRVRVKSYTSNVYGSVVVNPGPPSISFPYVSLVTAIIEGKGTVPIAPSSLLQLTFKYELELKSSARVFRSPVNSSNTFTVYVVEQLNDLEPEKDWTIEGLTNPSELIIDVTGTITINNVIYKSGTSNVVLGTSIKNQNYIYKLDVTSSVIQTLPLPGSVVTVEFYSPTAAVESKYYSIYDPKIFDASDIKGQTAALRDLNSNVWTDVPAPREALIEMAGRGFGTGALTALAAIGPQEKYMYGGESQWMPKIIQHTPFAITQRFLLPLKTGNEKFLDSLRTFSVDIHPRESGDLLSNMYLSVSLPALPAGYDYTPLVGRAILKKVEFLIDGQPIETLTDDWYILRDQLFLDADEKLAMYQATSMGQSESNVVPATDVVKMMIPLDFFFCRRHSDRKIGREKLEKPFFPLCAILQQTVTIRFSFHKSTWITNAPTDASGKPVDIINPKVLIEEITLSPRERMYYQSRDLNFKVNRVWAEAGQPYSGGKAIMNLTADFPVSMITWFVRNQDYEDETNSAYYKSRYFYGYSTDYIQAAVPVTFFNGVTINFLDIIQSGTLYLNNQNVLSNFPGALYYSYKQALDHGLSVPTKNIYMYCFGDNPKEYNQEGYVDFSKLNSQTTHLDLIFDPTLAPQIEKSYTMYLYYYGYVPLQISGGYAKLLSQ